MLKYNGIKLHFTIFSYYVAYSAGSQEVRFQLIAVQLTPNYSQECLY